MSKIRISITLPEGAVEWIDQKVEQRVYANRSHAIELLILEKIEDTRYGRRLPIKRKP